MRSVLFGFVLLVVCGLAHADARYDQAMDAYVDGKYQRALELALPLAEKKEEPRAWAIVVSSRCWLGDAKGAVAGFPQVPSHLRKDIARICRRSGVELEK